MEKRSLRAKPLITIIKIALTIAAFYLLLNHKLPDGAGGYITTWQAISQKLPTLELKTLLPFLLLAAFIKMLGILSSMTRWHLLLKLQGLCYPFLYLVGTFLIGRFIGTFLPSTLGLDGYKLYDAARGSGKVAASMTSTVIEKLLGLSGIFLTFLVSYPFGAAVFGEHEKAVTLITVPLALLATGAITALLLFPRPMVFIINKIPLPDRFKAVREHFCTALAAYKGRYRATFLLLLLSFNVHFATAAMYFFTALAIGARAPFWVVTLGSTVQIVATVLSPFTVAGEGIREIVQALMLSKELGLTESVLSAALGFWAAEALTLVGGIIWLFRHRSSREVLEHAE